MSILKHREKPFDDQGHIESDEDQESGDGSLSVPTRESMHMRSSGRTLHPDLMFAWLLYMCALLLAVFAIAIYLFSASVLLPSKYIPASLDIPCMSAFFLLAIIFLSLGRSIELSGIDDNLVPDQRGVTDKLRKLKESNIYDRVRLNRLSEVDTYRRYRRRKKNISDSAAVDKIRDRRRARAEEREKIEEEPIENLEKQNT